VALCCIVYGVQTTAMKTELEIQRAHDLLIGIVIGEAPNPFKPGSIEQECLTVACDVLCWVLGHDHNIQFQGNLDKIENWLKQYGVVLVKGE
jgi:hypothetical protein